MIILKVLILLINQRCIETAVRQNSGMAKKWYVEKVVYRNSDALRVKNEELGITSFKFIILSSFILSNFKNSERYEKVSCPQPISTLLAHVLPGVWSERLKRFSCAT